MKFLLYGAYGYSGRLIARMAKDFGLEPILAGRSEEKTSALAAELGMITGFLICRIRIK